MPRLSSQRVPKYGKHKQSGQARVVLNGRHFLLGPYGSAASRREYDRLVAEWVAGGRQLPAAGADVTISTLIVRFWDHAKGYYQGPAGKATRELGNFKSALRRLRKLYGATPPREFGPLALKAVRGAMIEQGWCRNVVNRQTTRIRQVFKWAAAEELIPPSVFHGLQAVAGLQHGRGGASESEPVKSVPEQHVHAIKDHVSRQVWAMIELQLLTGMRSDEVTGMRPVDLNTTGKNWIYSPPRHKNLHRGHRRDVALGPRARQILEPFLAGRPFESFVFSPAEAERDRREKRHAARKTPLSCGNRPGTNQRRRPLHQPGERYTTESYLVAVYRGCDAAFPAPPGLAQQRVPSNGRNKRATRGETDGEWKARLGAKKWAELRRWIADHRWHPHQLRHNAVTNLRRLYGLEAARAVLGQKSGAVTEIYAEVDAATVEKIMGEVG